MPEINLTEQEVQTLLRCLNDRAEPSEELAVMVTRAPVLTFWAAVANEI
jgi:hypothetical protein